MPGIPRAERYETRFEPARAKSEAAPSDSIRTSVIAVIVGSTMIDMVSAPAGME